MAALSELIEKYTSYNYELVDFTLATGVGRICTMRGWLPAQADHAQDQGLIVAYLKSGTAYYRNYCLQSDGTTYLWEAEQQITTLPTGLVDIALFRTNDFRVGVLGRDSLGQVHMTVTVRNYAGMSIYPEIFKADLLEASVTLTPITFTSLFSADHFSATQDETHISLCPLDYLDNGIVESVARENSTTMKIVFNYPLLSHSGFEDLFTVSLTPEVTSTSGGTTDYELLLSLNAEMDILTSYTVNYASVSGSSNRMRFNVSDSCRPFIDNFEVEFLGAVLNADEYFSANLSTELTFTEIEYLNGYSVETDKFVAEVNAELTLMDLDGIPI